MAKEQEILLAGFTETNRSDFLAIGHERLCLPDEQVFRGGTAPAGLVFILEGEGSIWKKETRLGTLREGAIIGEAALFSSNGRSNGKEIKAESQMRILEFRKQEIFNFFKWKEERLFKLFILNIVTILLGKLNRTDEKLIRMEDRLKDQVVFRTSGEGL